MSIDYSITLHPHYGGKFEERKNKVHYVGELGSKTLDYDYDKLSLTELKSIFKEDCNYKGNVSEIWWRCSDKGSEVRRIFGSKCIIDMAPKLKKCRVVHIYAVDEPVEGLALLLISRNFVDVSDVITIDHHSSKVPPAATLEYGTHIDSLPPSKQDIQRSLTSTRNGGLSLTAAGVDGKQNPNVC